MNTVKSQLNRLFLLAVVCTGVFGFASSALAASRYWVGGTATWDGTTTANWSATSGGASGASVPTQYDDVYFDANSASSTVTVSASSAAHNLNFTGFTGTVVHPASTSLVINGSLTLASTMTYTLGSGSSSSMNFNSTTTGNTLTTGGKTLGNTSFTGVGGAWTLQDSLTVNTGSATISFTAGTLNTNNQTVNANGFSVSGSNARTINLGSSSVNLYGGNGSLWTVSGSNAVINATSSNITLNPSADNSTFSGGGFAYNNVIFNAGVATTLNISNSGGTFTNLTINGRATKTGVLNLTSDITVSNTLTLNGNSSTNRIIIISSVLGTPRTMTVNGSILASNMDFRDITGAGTASWDLSNISGGSGNSLGNVGITFTPSQTNYWVGNSGNWSDVTHWASTSGGTGGSGRVPLPQDDARFDANSITLTGQTVSQDMPRMGRNIDWTGTLNFPSWKTNIVSSGNNTFYGSLTLYSSGGIPGGSALLTECRTSCTVKTNTKSFNNTSLSINAFGGSVSLLDDISGINTLSPNYGTFNSSSFNVSTGAVQMNNSGGPKTINMGTGTWNLTGTGNVWVATSGNGVTINPGLSTLVISNTSASTKTFLNSTGAIYNNITIPGGGGSLTFSSAVTANKLTIGFPKTVIFTANTTNTFTQFTARGSAGNLITLQSSTPGTKYTLKQTSGFVSSDWMSITDSTATGGAGWFAGTNSTLSNSTGWQLLQGPQQHGVTFQNGKIKIQKGKVKFQFR